MLVGFYLIRRRNYDLGSFYSRTGECEYSSGWNTRALAATALGFLVAFVGVYAPLLGLDSLGSLSVYIWFLGIAVSAVAYAILMPKESPEVAEPAMEIAEDLK